MATLFIASSPREGQWFPIQHKSLVVGRDEGLIAQVVAPGVSRKHFQIRFDPDNNCYHLTDLGSKNGVFLNSKRITQEVELKKDDLIRIGGTLLFFPPRTSGTVPARCSSTASADIGLSKRWR